MSKLPRLVRHELQQALAAARLENCGIDPAVQEAMRLYLASWVAGPIERVLAWSEGRGSLGRGGVILVDERKPVR